jgi:hypothetical protein
MTPPVVGSLKTADAIPDAVKAAEDFETIRAQVVELFADAQAHIVSIPAAHAVLDAPAAPALPSASVTVAPLAPAPPALSAPPAPTSPAPAAPAAVPPPPPPAGAFLSSSTSHIGSPGSDPIETFAPPPQMDWGPARAPRLSFVGNHRASSP